MEKLKRNERIAAIGKILSDHPSQIFTLGYFCELFDTAKSTVSEDLSALNKAYTKFHLGMIQTVTGASGGVCFIPEMPAEKKLAYVEEICHKLNEKDRLLPGGFIYIQDILTQTSLLEQLGIIMASRFYSQKIDFVLTVETKGIPFALMVARALGVSLVIARRDYKVYEGPVLTINFVSATDGRMQTMSLPKRSVKAGQKALIIDDFMKGGGTLHGMCELMHEFDVEVVGMGVLMQSAFGESMVDPQVVSLLTIHMQEEAPFAAASKWLKEDAEQNHR